MNFENITAIRVIGLRGDLTLRIDPAADFFDTRLHGGKFVRGLSFRQGAEMVIQPASSREEAAGSIELVAPPGLKLFLVNCHGRRLGPGSQQHLMTGDHNCQT